MEDQQQLAACPFCGGEPECARTLNFPPDDWQWYVRCYCFVAPAAWDESRDKAVEEWNRRASPSSSVLERAREALRNLISGYVNTLENGRDRIIFLGGQCDSVETMERSDPNLRAARSALAEIDRALGGGNAE